MISELGLRYRPSNQADLEAHAAALGLLAMDCADVPPEYLDRAARRWVMNSPYLPKASDLIGLAKTFLPSQAGGDRSHQPWTAQMLADRANSPERRAAENADPNRKWIAEGDALKLVPIDYFPPDQRDRCTPEQAAAVRRMVGEAG